jgi:hypothetical protein
MSIQMNEIEKRLWSAADQMWANTGLRPSDWCSPLRIVLSKLAFEGDKMGKFFWAITLLGCAVGCLVGVGGVLFANGAPQEAAAASIAVACAVIPYCFARAVDEIRR